MSDEENNSPLPIKSRTSKRKQKPEQTIILDMKEINQKVLENLMMTDVEKNPQKPENKFILKLKSQKEKLSEESIELKRLISILETKNQEQRISIEQQITELNKLNGTISIRDKRINELEEKVSEEINQRLNKQFSLKAATSEQLRKKYSTYILISVLFIMLFTALTILEIICDRIISSGNGLFTTIDTKTMLFLLVKRGSALMTSFLLLYYSIKIYNKERDIEEFYNSKSTVASSLPDFIKLIKDENLKDSLVQETMKALYKSHTTEQKYNEKDNISPLDLNEKLIHLLAGIGIGKTKSE